MQLVEGERVAPGKPKILCCWIEPPTLAEFLPETEVEMIRPSSLFPPATEDELKALVPDADLLGWIARE
jgi:hypothetical protein